MQAKFMLGFICIGLMISVLLYRNNMYSYTNEFIIDKTWAFEKVGAANLEFMQGGFYLQKFLQEHPDFQYAVETKRSGNFIIGTDNYLDIFNRKKYQWIRAYKPYAQFNYNYLLIKVP